MTSPVVSGAQGDGGRMDDETLAKVERLVAGMAMRLDDQQGEDSVRIALNHIRRELGDTRARLARAAVIEREARTVMDYLAVHGPRVVCDRLAAALGATDQACSTCGGTGAVVTEAQVGAPGSGGVLSCPDCKPLPVRRLDNDLSRNGDWATDQAGGTE